MKGGESRCVRFFKDFGAHEKRRNRSLSKIHDPKDEGSHDSRWGFLCHLD